MRNTLDLYRLPRSVEKYTLTIRQKEKFYEDFTNGF